MSVTNKTNTKTEKNIHGIADDRIVSYSYSCNDIIQVYVSDMFVVIPLEEQRENVLFWGKQYETEPSGHVRYGRQTHNVPFHAKSGKHEDDGDDIYSSVIHRRIQKLLDKRTKRMITIFLYQVR